MGREGLGVVAITALSVAVGAVIAVTLLGAAIVIGRALVAW